MKAKVTLSNIRHYLIGNMRYKIYYSYGCWLIRKHIREQIEFRIRVMSKDCYEQGSCTMCGCQTTHLQMSNKACDKPCYPTMMSRRSWKLFKRGSIHYDRKERIFWRMNLETNKPLIFKRETK